MLLHQVVSTGGTAARLGAATVWPSLIAGDTASARGVAAGTVAAAVGCCVRRWEVGRSLEFHGEGQLFQMLLFVLLLTTSLVTYQL
jgi:hypothetical protein